MNIRSFWQDLAKIFLQTKCLLLLQEIQIKLLKNLKPLQSITELPIGPMSFDLYAE